MTGLLAQPARIGERFLTGVIEGFYGREWSLGDRLAYAGFLPLLGLNSYIYCPKGDPFLRKRWFEHWPAEAWGNLKLLSGRYRDSGLHFGIGLSPFALYRRYGGAERRQLHDKICRLLELDVSLLALLFDDMPGEVPDLAERQAEIVADVEQWAPHQRLLMCPTYYSRDPVLEQHFGKMPSDYWSRLGALLPVAVDVFWTGEQVCSEAINRGDLKPIRELLERRLTLWDNYPVNDGAARSKHLYLEPLSRRDPDIRDQLAGHFCNPMNQAYLSLPALRGLAQLYGQNPAPDLEADIMGDRLWAQLRRDSDRFQGRGLSGLDGDLRQELTRLYASLPGPAAGEVADWLRGEYTFDPACLTG